MKRIISPIFVLFAAVVLFASCLNETETEVTYYQDTAITAFSIGTLNKTVHTTNSAGADSVYTTTVDCSAYKFYIDQTNRLIYNADSLSKGIDVSKVITTMTSKNSGVIVVNQKTADKSADSLVYYSSEDSLNFTEPLEVRVYNTSGTAYRSYKVSVNVHKEQADSFQWHALSTNSALAGLMAMKAVNCNGSIYVFGNDGTQTKVYSTKTSDGNKWAVASTTFGADAYKNVCVKDGYIYMLDGGKIYKSSDASAWTEVATSDVKQIIGASSAKLYAISAAGKIVASADNGQTWTAESMDEDASLLPTDDISFCYLPLSTNANTDRLWIVGNRSVEACPSDSTSQIWSKIEENAANSENQPWSYFDISSDNKFKSPRLSNLQVSAYDSKMLAFGGEAMGKSTLKTFACFYITKDGGLTWQADDTVVVPEGFSSSTTSFAMIVDSENHIWIICGKSGQVWKGRLNKLGWKTENSVFTK